MASKQKSSGILCGNLRSNSNTGDDCEDILITADDIQVKLETSEEEEISIPATGHAVSSQPASFLFTDVSSGTNLASQKQPQQQPIVTPFIVRIETNPQSSEIVPNNCSIDSSHEPVVSNLLIEDIFASKMPPKIKVNGQNSEMPKQKENMTTLVQQVELMLELKRQLDLAFKQLSHFRGACRSVDRFNRTVREMLYKDETNDGQLFSEFVKFERNFRVWRKRLYKVDRKLLNVDLYDKFYGLYENLVIEDSIIADDDLIKSNPIEIRPVIQDSPVMSIAVVDSSQLSSSLVSNVSDNSQIKTPQTPQRRTTRTMATSVAPVSLNSRTETTNPVVSSPKFSSKSSKASKKSKSIKVQEENRIVINLDFPLEDDSISLSNGSKKRKKTKKPKVAEKSYPASLKCELCQKTFPSRAHLKYHRNSYHGIRIPCPFDGCSSSYTRREHLNQHIRIVHTKEAPLLCCDFEGCDYSTYHKERMQNHRNLHTGTRFECEVEGCLASYSFKKHLSKHVRAVHTKDASLLRCDFEGCEYSTHRSSVFKVHQAIHTTTAVEPSHKSFGTIFNTLA